MRQIIHRSFTGYTPLAVSTLRWASNSEADIMHRLEIMAIGVLFILATLVSASEAQAGMCRMTGCELGYIFLPTVYASPTYLLGNHKCSFSGDLHTFVEDPLPMVNQIVTMKASRKGLFTEQEIEASLDEFQPPYVDTFESNGECVAKWKEPGDGSFLVAGDKVRILGYRTFVGHHTRPGPRLVEGLEPKPITFPWQLMFILVKPENARK